MSAAFAFVVTVAILAAHLIPPTIMYKYTILTVVLLLSCRQSDQNTQTPQREDAPTAERPAKASQKEAQMAKQIKETLRLVRCLDRSVEQQFMSLNTAALEVDERNLFGGKNEQVVSILNRSEHYRAVLRVLRDIESNLAPDEDVEYPQAGHLVGKYKVLTPVLCEKTGGGSGGGRK